MTTQINKSNIFKRMHELVKTTVHTLSTALRQAWVEAKEAIASIPVMPLACAVVASVEVKFIPTHFFVSHENEIVFIHQISDSEYQLENGQTIKFDAWTKKMYFNRFPVYQKPISELPSEIEKMTWRENISFVQEQNKRNGTYDKFTNILAMKNGKWDIN